MSRGRESNQHDAAAALVRAAIRGDRDALGDLCMMVRPDVFTAAYRWLLGFRMESHAEDLTQDILCDVIRSFPIYDPTRSHIFGWLQPIIRHGCLDFVNRDRVRMKEVPLPDNTDVEGAEFQADPLDRLSREAWETDVPTPPISMSNRFGIRRIGRATLKAREKRRKERELQAKAERMGSGKRKRDRRYKPHQQMVKINRNREAFAEASP